MSQRNSPQTRHTHPLRNHPSSSYFLPTNNKSTNNALISLNPLMFANLDPLSKELCAVYARRASLHLAKHGANDAVTRAYVTTIVRVVQEVDVRKSVPTNPDRFVNACLQATVLDTWNSVKDNANQRLRLELEFPFLSFTEHRQPLPQKTSSSISTVLTNPELLITNSILQ